MLEGYQSTIFAYGQTGSGKTFTMQGNENREKGNNSQMKGIIPRAISSLFKKIENQPKRVFMVSVSFMQIYN